LFSEHGQGYQALSDRGDIGGLSTAVGFDGLPSVFVCDGYPGRALPSAASGKPAFGWVRRPRPFRPVKARADARRVCSPPKCGNDDDPPDKAGAVLGLRLVPAGLDREMRRTLAGWRPTPQRSTPTDLRRDSRQQTLPRC
jgi:DEAD/DEAH box helicase domain-containing protein